MNSVSSGKTTMPNGSRCMCGSGFRVTWPRRYAVRSPPSKANQACAASCTVRLMISATNHRVAWVQSGAAAWTATSGLPIGVGAAVRAVVGQVGDHLLDLKFGRRQLVLADRQQRRGALDLLG